MIIKVVCNREQEIVLTFYTCDFKKKTPADPTGAKNDWSNQLLLMVLLYQRNYTGITGTFLDSNTSSQLIGIFLSSFGIFYSLTCRSSCCVILGNQIYEACGLATPFDVLPLSNLF